MIIKWQVKLTNSWIRTIFTGTTGSIDPERIQLPPALPHVGALKPRLWHGFLSRSGYRRWVESTRASSSLNCWRFELSMNRKLRTLIRNELHMLIIDRVAIVSIFVTVLIGCWSIHQGQFVIQRQRQVISQIPDWQQAQFTRARKKLGSHPHAGYLAYETFLYTHNPPSPWAGLATGLRNIHPFALKIRLLGLIPQIYESEIRNPLHH